MVDFILLLVMLISWSCVCLVPASLAGNRRNRKKPAYWDLLIFAIILDIATVFGSLQLLHSLELIKVGAIGSPAFGALVGGLTYWKLCKRRDEISANQQLHRGNSGDTGAILVTQGSIGSDSIDSKNTVFLSPIGVFYGTVPGGFDDVDN